MFADNTSGGEQYVAFMIDEVSSYLTMIDIG